MQNARSDCPHVWCEPSVCSGVLEDQDALVVCSDGVWDAVDAKRVAQVVRDTFNPDFVCRSAYRSTDDVTACIATRQRRKTSMHTGLFRLFRSSSSSSSEEDARSPLRLRVHV